MTDEAQEKRAVAVVSGDTMLTDSARFEHTWRVAKVFAGSQLVPSHLRGKVEDVMIALHIAERLRDDPLTVLQSIYIVSGRAGWSSNYMVARVNQSGLIRGRITWTSEGEGADLAVTAHATLTSGESVSATVTMKMAMGEGWVRNSKYQTMPEHMLRWRSVAMLVRLYFPEVMLGIPSVDEIDDVPPPVKDISPKADDGRPVAAIQLEQFAASGEASGSRSKRSRKKAAEGSSPPQAEADGSVVSEAHPPAAEPAAVPDQEQESKLAYLDRIIGQLEHGMTLEEIESAHEVVKQELAGHPGLLGIWNANRLRKEAQLRA